MSRHFSALPLTEQSIEPHVPLEFRSAACHSLADLLDKGSALDIPGWETSAVKSPDFAVKSPDNENKSCSAAHNGLVIRLIQRARPAPHLPIGPSSACLSSRLRAL